MNKPTSITLTWEELKRLYLNAYQDGYEGNLVCGGMGKRTKTSDLPEQQVAIALVRAKANTEE